MRTRAAAFAAALLFVAANDAAVASELRTRNGNDAPGECAATINVERLAHVDKIEIDYPSDESGELGEGWVEVLYSVRADGTLENVENVDAMGTRAYGTAVEAALRKATFTPAITNGRPADGNNFYNVLFAIERDNRALVHYFGFSETYDTARRQRAAKQYQESIDTTLKSFADPLNMYEIATLSHGVMLSYIGLKDYRHALIYARHAAFERGRFLANDARPQAQAWLTWLEAANNNQRNALCALAWLKRKFASYTPDADTLARVEQARAELYGTGPVRTPIELIDNNRNDVPAGWSHDLIRHAFRFEHVGPKAAKFRAVCQAGTWGDEIREGKQETLNPAQGECTLYFYGERGATFDLVEY